MLCLLQRRESRWTWLPYSGSQPGQDVLSNPHIHLHLMREPPNFQKYVPRLLAYALKPCSCSESPFDTNATGVMVLLPPCEAQVLVVDWHNYGYSILALALGPGHLLVRICHWCEKTFGKKAASAFCVSQAMQEDLKSNWGVQADVLYDKPPIRIPANRHGRASHPLSTSGRGVSGVGLRGPIDRLVVSSTSWTEDEDFSVLLDALKKYDVRKEAGDSGLPDLFCVITGKGPQKEYYLSLIRNNPLAHVKFLTPWLSAQDYPKMLGSADLGVCLHTSSSKLDLPMKVVDMFGCGLPVCAVDYPCLRELVKPGETGLVFKTSTELCQHICDLLQGFPQPSKLLDSLRANVHKWQAVRWDDNWREVALPKFRGNL
ncbi:hypothetical protein MTO96_036943 [Rhipicephalus appendiculatus]